MVNWDRVEELRSKGWEWDRIADDPKVGFHPEASVHEPGRALRGLYHRQRSRERRERPSGAAKPKKVEEERKREWTLSRVGLLLTPILGIWFVVAYFAPSPVGIVVPALPYLALGLTVAAFLLVFGLWRSTGPRWSKPLRTTLVVGVILGLMISGIIGLTGALFFGCPYLPSASTGTTEPAPGWIRVSAGTWQDSGRPIVFYYGATWCPYCSASSWALWDALRHFGSAQPTPPVMGYSAEDGIPYVDLAASSFTYTSSSVAFQASEDTSGNTGTFPSTSNCYQQAYFSAYGGSAIPFFVVNGQYVHGGSSLIDASAMSTWAHGANGGYSTVYQSVISESGSPWSVVQSQTWWLMALMAKSTGTPVSQIASQYHWSSTTASQVTNDVAALR